MTAPWAICEVPKVPRLSKPSLLSISAISVRGDSTRTVVSPKGRPSPSIARSSKNDNYKKQLEIDVNSLKKYCQVTYSSMYEKVD